MSVAQGRYSLAPASFDRIAIPRRRRGEVRIPTFITFLNWTDQGAKTAKDTGKRSKAAEAMAQKLGGKILSAYITTGQYDVVATLDMPSGEAMAKFVAGVAASGNARTTTVRAFTADEFVKAVADAPTI